MAIAIWQPWPLRPRNKSANEERGQKAPLLWPHNTFFCLKWGTTDTLDLSKRQVVKMFKHKKNLFICFRQLRSKKLFFLNMQVYSMGMDASNLYVALDQSLNHFGFGQQRGEEKGTRSTQPPRNHSKNNNWKRNTNARWQ